MKSNFTSIMLSGAVAAMLLLAGCAKENSLNPVDKSCTELELADVNSGEMLSKAAIDGTGFPRDGRIGLFFFKDEAGAVLYCDGACSNVEYSYNQDKGKWTANPAIRVGSTPGYLYGYYPYNGAYKDVKAIAVESSLDGDDVMYAAKQDPVTDRTAGNVAITMRHALARVSITVKNKGYSGAAKLSRIEFVGAKTAPSGTLNALDGSISATTSDVTLEVSEANQQITEAGTRYECLLVPSEVDAKAQNVTLRLTIDGQQKTVALTGENALKIVSGVKARLTIDLSDSGLSVVDGIQVDDWQTVTVGGHTVTVKFAEEQMPGLANDIIYTPKITNDGKVRLEAVSRSQKRLECYLEGKASCAKGTTNLVYYQPIGHIPPIIFISHVFTISDISSDITATIGYPRPTEISLSLSNHTTYAGCAFKLSATVLPDDAFNKNFTWSSSNPSVATVDEDGKVTTKAEGVADITATTEVGGVTATCKVNVETYKPIILPGKFSVASGKKVSFSQGNLRYTPSLGFWWFFNNQYEQGHNQDQLSLFTWGFGDWSTDWTTKSYESGNFTDWGTKIGDGNTWRTLTKDEWEYLLGDNGRTDAANKFGYATVCGMHGLLLLPDEFNDPKTNESTSQACVEKKFVPQSSKGWEQNVYTFGASWDEMQAAGAVFLPAAGYRNGSEINVVGNYGYYWFSTPGDGQYGQHFAYFYTFKSDNFAPISTDSRYHAYSVRLVTDVK